MTYPMHAEAPAGHDYEPVRVHVVSQDPPAEQGKPKRREVVSFETYVLTANDPVQAILPDNPDRCIAYVQAFDNNVVLSTSQSQGQANTGIADLSAAATQVFGQLISKANGAMMPVRGTNAVFASCATAKPARISVQIVDYA